MKKIFELVNVSVNGVGAPVIAPTDNIPFLVIASYNAANVATYGAENICDVSNKPFAFDTFGAGSVFQQRLQNMLLGDFYPNLLRSGEVLLQPAAAAVKVLILKVINE